MSISQSSLDEIRQATIICEKELTFYQINEEERTELYNEYNHIKLELIPELYAKLEKLGTKISREINIRIKEWEERKSFKLTQSGDEEREFDTTDILFLTLLITLVNQYTIEYSSLKHVGNLEKAYDTSAKYYTKLEADKIERATGQRPIITNQPRFDLNNQFIKTNFQYTLKALSTVGEKYYPELERIIKEGYINGEGIKSIADKLRNAVDPHSTSSKVVNIYDRIARTEIAYITEAAKLDSWNSMSIRYMQLVTRHDSKVCPVCRLLDGQVFEISEIGVKVGVIIHVRCRCTWVPVYDVEDLSLIPIMILPFLDDK